MPHSKLAPNRFILKTFRHKETLSSLKNVIGFLNRCNSRRYAGYVECYQKNKLVRVITIVDMYSIAHFIESKYNNWQLAMNLTEKLLRCNKIPKKIAHIDHIDLRDLHSNLNDMCIKQSRHGKDNDYIDIPTTNGIVMTFFDDEKLMMFKLMSLMPIVEVKDIPKRIAIILTETKK